MHLAVHSWWRLLRPRQWLKNGLVLVGVVFSLRLDDPDAVRSALLACLLFCGMSSAGYIINDLRDAPVDRQHPRKRHRPIAAGQISPGAALACALLLGVGSLGAAYLLRPLFAVIVLLYALSTLFYSLVAKHVLLVDIFVLAAGFLLRAVGGAFAIDVHISPWLYLATLLGALLIGLGKRRQELAQMEGATDHRKVLTAYGSVAYIDQLLQMVLSMAVMTYALYTFSSEHVGASPALMSTVPIVLFGAFRYLYLLRETALGGSPEDLLHDRPLALSAGLWLLLTVGILYLTRPT